MIRKRHSITPDIKRSMLSKNSLIENKDQDQDKTDNDATIFRKLVLENFNTNRSNLDRIFLFDDVVYEWQHKMIDELFKDYEIHYDLIINPKNTREKQVQVFLTRPTIIVQNTVFIKNQNQ